MTKTLTEQWKNGELGFGYYYIDFGIGGVPMLFNGLEFYCERTQKPNAIKTILAPVPSYEAWQESQKKRALWFEEKAKIRNRLENKIKLLEEQLNYALETMGQIAKLSDNTVDSVQCAHAICLIEERLKEIKGVK